MQYVPRGLSNSSVLKGGKIVVLLRTWPCKQVHSLRFCVAYFPDNDLRAFEETLRLQGLFDAEEVASAYDSGYGDELKVCACVCLFALVDVHDVCENIIIASLQELGGPVYLSCACR
jgi:hypothetical protein